MIVVIFSIIGICSILGLLAIRGSLYNWLLFLAFITITLQSTKVISVESSIFLWAIVISGIIFSINNIRHKLFSAKILQLVKERLPDFGFIKQEILPTANDNIWFEENILRGNLNIDQLSQIPKINLTAKEQAFLNNQVETLCQILNNWKITQDRVKLPSPIWEYLRQQKFFAMNAPLDQGGLGFSPNARFEIVQKIATRSISVAVTVMVPNSFELVKLLLQYGTTSQKEEYLSQLVAGEYIPTFALNSEENTGVVCYQKYQDQEVLGVCLNWEENKVLLAPIATLLVLAVKLYDPNDFLCLNKKDLGINICLVPTKLPNIFNNLNNSTFNQDFLNGLTKGKNVFVPLDFVVGVKDSFGQNYNEMIDCLSTGKDISFLALSAAINKLCLKNTSAHSVVRTQLGLPIIQFAEVKANLAKVSGYNYMMEAMRNFLLTASFSNCSLEAVIIAKTRIADLSKEVISATTDIYGSNITLGIKNHLAISYQNITAKLFSSSILSAISKCHPFLQYELEAIESKDVALFDNYFFEHISYALSNFAKVILHVGTNKLFCLGSRNLNEYGRNLNFFSIVLACLVELSLLKFNALLKHNERLSTLLWDVFSHLCMGSAIIKYHNQNQEDLDDLYFAKWSLQVCLYNLQETIVEILDIFPNKFLSRFISRLIFPFGKKYNMPSKVLGEQISNIITKNSTIRTRLLSGCYIAANDHLEVAFGKILNVESIKQQAVERKVLTKSESNLIKEATLAVKNAMVVDEFGV